ncbi:hypothetical protein H0S70_07205 [Chryseobacterium manosquense]|uniref:Uncharacterized protein n=1 Tax=Chryseobacterium manosquense TaxID=2754694 RepID=A0A7H1DT85_9FLAO|nr:hypothetical protein [Chryseobacterium manosquense]QNS40193.1 hypothetical protein H0S70_07205 [Chryseobacterium manosquense]
MNNIKKTSGQREIVVFDDVLATRPGGLLNIDNVDAKSRFTDGIIPAGTLVVMTIPNVFKVLKVALTDVNTVGAVGLVHRNVAIEDFTEASIVTDGIVRIDALPAPEKTGIAFIQAKLPNLKFY